MSDKHPAEVLADQTAQAADAYDLPGVKRAADMLRRIPVLEESRDDWRRMAESDEAARRAAVAERDKLRAEVEALRELIAETKEARNV